MLLQSESLYEGSSNLESGVRKIAFAILVQALRDSRADDQSKQAREWRSDALEWFASADESPGSLTWVCYILGWEPGRTRSALAALRMGQTNQF